MKKTMGLILLGMWLLAAVGCAADTTETTIQDVTNDPIVGFWVVPVGESIPTYYTDFLDPWALKIYIDINESETVLDLVGGAPFYDVTWGTKTFENEDGASVGGYRLSAALRVLTDGTTFGVAFIHRDAAGFLHPGTLNGYYFTESDAELSITLSQILADYAIDLELHFETAPQIANVTMTMFAADHTEINAIVLPLSSGTPWTVDAEDPVAYVIVEENHENGFVERTLYSRIDGENTMHSVFRLTQYGFATPVACTIVWGD